MGDIHSAPPSTDQYDCAETPDCRRSLCLPPGEQLFAFRFCTPLILCVQLKVAFIAV